MTQSTIPFIDLAAQQERLRPEIDAAIARVLAHGKYILGPEVSELEERLGYYLIPIQAMIFARLPLLPFRANAAMHAALPYLSLLLVFTVWSQLSGHFNQCYIPYQTWLFGFPGGDPFGF